MKLSYEDHDSITVLTLSGELTDDHIDSFRRSCQERFQTGIRHVVVDVKHLMLIDSAGLEALLWLLDRVGELSGQMRLVGPDETLRKVLEITRLLKKFDIHESIQSAAKSVRFKS